ncbi:MAG: citrate synthase family protein [Deltaproteobacteria bacterium]|nr:citrate synthase family protein [Deltaproteobacteria bacterium]
MSTLDQSRSTNQSDADWLSSKEATELLGVKAATLYTYVSRGLVRRVPAPEGRGSRYSRADLVRLRDRKDSRGGHRAVAGDAMRWGQPVIDTEVGGITDGGPVYRGRLATTLAENGVPFEEVVDLLLGVEHAPWDLFGGGTLRERRGGQSSGLLDRMLGAMTAAGADDAHRHIPGREIPRVRRILTLLASAVPGIENAPRPALDTALTLLADHGLNASTFAARVAASTGADLYACVVAGLATLSGPRHGGAGARVEALLEECQRRGAAVTLRERLARGEALPGFGHPLYPEGDPRCAQLLAMATDVGGESPIVRAASDLAAAAGDAGYQAPNVDLGLVAAAAALGLEEGGSLGLFAVGRAAGWMAHALEQQAAGFLLRPRVRYVGPPVASPPEAPGE